MNSPTGRSHIRIYRYLSAKRALETLESGELRVGRLSELNDPFEFMPALASINPDAPHGLVDHHLSFLVRDFDPKWGIICFSEEIHDPVLWSHYAEKHQGIALGFDVFQDDTLIRIKYPDVRPTFDVIGFGSMTVDDAKSMIWDILSSKAPSWKYEKEHRVFVDLASSRTANGQYFHKIPPDCLKQVVLGICCTTTDGEVQQALDRGKRTDVSVARARRCITNFRVLC